MRILLTGDPELPVPPRLYGGIERIIDILARGLRSRGHQVGLVANGESQCAVDALFPWPGRRSQCARSAALNLLALRSAAMHFQPDVLHSFSRLLYMLPLMPLSLPKIMSYQRAPASTTVRWASRIARRTMTFTGCSEDICRKGRVSAGSWVAIHNCVEVDKYTFSPTVADDAPLVFLSRLDRIKGAHNAIAIARRTGRRLILAGNHSTTGEEGDYFRKHIQPSIGRDGIEYLGPVDDEQKNELLGKAVAMVVPIEWDEPFGIVFAEALACGTPVISSPRGALPEIVEAGRHGFLVNDIEEGVEAVERVNAIDRWECRQRAEHLFSASTIVGQYEQLYTEVGGHPTSVSTVRSTASAA